MASALLIIDVQNDFCDGGSLAVADSPAILEPISRLRSGKEWACVALTQDWHPQNHTGFASNNPGLKLFEVRKIEGQEDQVMWPDHCVQGSRGAEFHPGLHVSPSDVVVRKGTCPDVDSYSGFGDASDDKRFEKTPLEAELRSRGVTDVYVCGLATDYCVAYTCLDAAKLGFRVFCVLSACRGISSEGIAAALDNMRAAGVTVVENLDSCLGK